MQSAGASWGTTTRLSGRSLCGLRRYQPAELAFIRVVAWLYVQYFEVGGVSIRFLASLFDGYGLDSACELRAHVDRTGRLRTYLQHNLDPSSESDAVTRATCEDWFEGICGSRVPGREEHWSLCVAAQVRDAKLLFGTLLEAVRAIERDEAREVIVEQWRIRVTRHHSPAAFDPIVAAAAGDMGRDFLDVPRFRKRHYDKWADAIRGLDGAYDFEREARRLVEQSLMSDATAVLPITGTDIIREFDIEPGPRVGELLALARTLFEAEPCDRQTLLSRVQAEVTG